MMTGTMKRWTGRMLSQGSVVVAPFVYTDYTAVRMRPALVINTRASIEERGDVILMAISSRPPVGRFEVPLRNWKDAGLRFKSKVVTSKIITVNAMLVQEIGALSPEDLNVVKTTLLSLFDLRLQ